MQALRTANLQSWHAAVKVFTERMAKVHDYYKSKGTIPLPKQKPPEADSGKRKLGSSNWQPVEKAQPASKAKLELKPGPRADTPDPVSGPRDAFKDSYHPSDEINRQIAKFNDNQAEIIYTTMIGLFRADNPFAGAGSSNDAAHIDHRT